MTVTDMPTVQRTWSSTEAMAPRPYVVADRWEETADTVTLTLLPHHDIPPLAQFRPGQFTMLYAPAIGEVPISISGDPSRQHDGRLVHTIRAVGAVSRALCAVSSGAVLGVRGPFGSDWTMDRATGTDLLLVAGGIGLAPLRPALLWALNQREQFGRITVLVGARTRADLLYRGELAEWAWRGDLNVEVTVDEPSEDWRGSVGLISGPLATAKIDPDSTTAFLCGPEVMLRACGAQLRDRGLPAERIRLSLERNMKCGIGWCGHCQLGPVLLCRDGPVLSWDEAAELLTVREL